MSIKIRAFQPQDIQAFHDLRVLPGVQENLLTIPTLSYQQTVQFIQGLNQNDHLLVAEVESNQENQQIGFVGIHIDHPIRLRHSGEVVLMVHPEYQNQGIGSQLLKELLVLSDQWLKLVRVELQVFTDNKPAIHLYQKTGFVIEGVRKYAAIKNGKYSDLILMARYRPSLNN